MIGRDVDVREIATAIQNATNVIVAGPRRTGKTSVCDAALLQAHGAGFYVVAVDLFRIADASELAEAIATAVLKNRPPAHKVIVKARQFGRQALSAAQGALALKLSSELGEAVEI